MFCICYVSSKKPWPHRSLLVPLCLFRGQLGHGLLVSFEMKLVSMETSFKKWVFGEYILSDYFFATNERCC